MTSLSVVLAIVNCGMMAHLTWREFHREDLISLHNVAVIDNPTPLGFHMETNDNVFYASFCQDSDLTPEIRPGVTLILLRYREDRHNHCFEVNRPDEGYILLRSENGNPVLTSHASMLAQ